MLPCYVYIFVSLLILIACGFGIFFLISKAYRSPSLLTKKHKTFLAVGGLTVCYAVAAFFRLGNQQAPQTFYQTTVPAECFTLSFKEPVNIREIWTFSGIGNVVDPHHNADSNFQIFANYEGQWMAVADIHHDYVFTWKKQPLDFTTDALMIQGTLPGEVLNELILLGPDGKRFSATLAWTDPRMSDPEAPLRILDEQSTLPPDVSYFSSMYFDEIYHARTSCELLRGLAVYETAHPPLGKEIISLGIVLFGMTPWGFRTPGVVAGILMIPIIYLLAQELFKNRRAAFFAAFLLSVDFMHITQTRIATVDSFLVLFILLMFLFMAKYAALSLDEATEKQRLYLFFSGFFMGAAVAVKWNGLFSAFGLAVWFFGNLFIKHQRYIKNHGKERNKEALHLVIGTCSWCVLFFVIVPVLLYFITFLPVLNGESFAELLESFFQWQQSIFKYHSTLEESHPFASSWYSWPIISRPIWYAIASARDKISTISLLGNPFVWLPMIPCLLFTILNGFKSKDSSSIPVAAGYLGSYLPWIFVSRSTFLYHYFPMTIFGILALAYVAKTWLETNCKRKGTILLIIYSCAAFFAFAVFFPILTGFPADPEYIKSLELLPNWIFYY